MLGNLRIGRPFGIDTYIHWSFWLLPGLILLSGALAGGLPMAAIDTAVVLAIFGCVVLHELGHALAARQFGVRTRDIVLYPIGGMARLERMPRSPVAEILIALAGPAVNFAIAVLLLPLMVFDDLRLFALAGASSVPEIFLIKVFWANAFIGLFNLLPAFPMDGGRVLRAVLSLFTTRLRATELAAAAGTGFAILFGVGALLQWFSPLMLILALFLYSIGQAELQSVRAEAGERRSEAFRGTPWRSFAFTNAVPSPHRDGWEYDAQLRMWTLWRNGMAVKRVGSP